MYRLKPFGVLDGREVPLIELFNDKCAVELLPCGAAVRAIRVPDRTNKLTDICLGYDDLESYRTLDACFGGTIGRCANRIGGARFTIDGRGYRVTANEGENCLHGGIEGFHKKLWEFTCEENAVTFSYISPDGEEGFPGAVRVEVTYRLTGDRLTIAYKAAAEQSTVVNLTNHTYFNLGGHSSGTVEDHVLTLRASRYTPMDSGIFPWGRWRRWRERRWISGHLRHLGAVSTIKPLTAGGDTTTTMSSMAKRALRRSCGAPPPASVWK